MNHDLLPEAGGSITIGTIFLMARRRRRRFLRRKAQPSPETLPPPEPPTPVVPAVVEEELATDPVEAKEAASAPVIEPADPVPSNDDGPDESEGCSGPDQLRVLAVFPDTSILRLIRESIAAFTEAVADTTPDAGYGFEMAMQRDYELFFFGTDMPVLGGDRLYDFISKAYAHANPDPRMVPGVVYLAQSGLQHLPRDLTEDARVKGVMSCPFEIARLLSYTEGVGASEGGGSMTAGGGAFLEKLRAHSSGPPAVKICGYTRLDEALAACAAGADALGINFYPKSKRYVPFEDCASWLSSLPAEVSRVGIFVNEDIRRVREILSSGLIDAAQLHGNETAEYCENLATVGIPIIKAFGVKDPSSLDHIVEYHTPWILLDAWCPEYGGSGKRFDQELAVRTVQQHPELRIILSGGLNAENVRVAAMAVMPAAVDVASGVEDSPGRKNLELVKRFIAEARLAGGAEN